METAKHSSGQAYFDFDYFIRLNKKEIVCLKAAGCICFSVGAFVFQCTFDSVKLKLLFFFLFIYLFFSPKYKKDICTVIKHMGQQTS